MFRLIVERTDIAVFVKNGERHRAHLDTLGYLGRPYYTLEQCRITEDGEGVKGWMGR